MISILMAYYNRLPHLRRTLHSIAQSSIKDVEIIIVDDASAPEQRPNSACNEFPQLNIKIHNVDKVDKWYINPCVVYNTAFSLSTGDIILIQNPECIHVGNILSACTNVTSTEYISFACYSLDEQQTLKIQASPVTILFPHINKKPATEGGEGWYNHPIYRQGGYHFASCITRDNFNALGGFDERYAHGVGYDDDELLYRIKLLGLKVTIPTEPYVYHQNHYYQTGVANANHWPNPKVDNKQIFEERTKKENKVKVN